MLWETAAAVRRRKRYVEQNFSGRDRSGLHDDVVVNALDAGRFAGDLAIIRRAFLLVRLSRTVARIAFY